MGILGFFFSIETICHQDSYIKNAAAYYTQLDDGTNIFFLLISFLKIDTWIALRNLAML